MIDEQRRAWIGGRIVSLFASLSGRMPGGDLLARACMAVVAELDQITRIGLSLAGQRRNAATAELTGPCRAAVYRRIWQDAADVVGAEVRPWGEGYLLICRGSQQVRVWQQFVPLGDPIALRLAGDKPTMHTLLSSADIPVPPHVVVATGDGVRAERFLRDYGPLVVKPARDTGAGSGVTGGVTMVCDLPAARARAARYDSRWLLLEATLVGTEYRVLVLDGVPIGAVRRMVPSTVGNGRTDIAGLIAAENARRLKANGWAGIWPLTLDLDAVLALRSQGLTARSVLPSGRSAAIHTGVSQGSERDSTVVDIDAPEFAGIRAAAADAATALGGSYISVELITKDPSIPLCASGGAVIEVNTTPGIVQHYVVSDGESVVPVAVPVLERLLATSSESARRSTAPTHYRSAD